MHKLITTSKTAVSALLAALTLTIFFGYATGGEQNKKTCVLRSGRTANALDRVVAILEVGGELKFTENVQLKKAKMSVVGNVTYDEKTLELPTGSKRARRSLRHYHKAHAVIKVADETTTPALGDQRRLIGVEIDEPKITLFSPGGMLSRDELDLVDLLFNSLLLDRLLPERPVARGNTWKHSEKLMAAMLGLDEVAKSSVRSTLSELTEAAAKMEMSGRVEGAIGGVSTEVEIKAKYRFNRKTKRIDWLGLLVEENRDIGHVARGLDVVARLRMQIAPLGDSKQLGDAALKSLPMEPTPKLTQLTYESPGGGWRIAHDRRWYVLNDDRDLAIWRMVDRGELLAQCNVAPLPKVKPGKQTTLEGFQQDIKEALGDDFGEFVEAGQRMNDSKYRVLRVVVRGLVSGLPIQWNYYLVADEQGHQVVFAFTVEGSLVKRLGEADEQFVGSLRFGDTQVAMSKPTDQKQKAGGGS